MSRELNMCVINAELVDEIRPLAGSQAEIMTRLGISWNSWIKVSAGLPVRQSVGERLRMRVLAQADALPQLRKRFPAAGSAGKIDREALGAAFLVPIKVRTDQYTATPIPRSVRKPAAAPAMSSYPR